MIYYAILMAVVGMYAFLLSSTNLLELNRLTKKTKRQKKTPRVSVCIPARNEHDNIERCLRSFMKQDYPDYEVLVLDDNSEDDTSAIVERLAKEDGRIRLIHGTPLPKGWKGKVHAMQQLYEHATGTYLLFTDADTTHQSISIRLGVDLAISNNAKFVSGYPTETCRKPIIASCIACMVFNTMLYLPIPLQNRIQKSWFSMAIGQYVLVERQSLKEIGGMEKIKNAICDDVQLARTFAKTGHKQIFCDMKRAVSCKMYGSFNEAFTGIERSVAGAIKLSPMLFVGTVFLVIILLGFIASPIVSVIALVMTGANMTSLLLLSGTILFWGSFAMVTTFHGYHFPVQIMGQLTFLFVIIMYVHGLYLKHSGHGFVWKGRKII